MKGLIFLALIGASLTWCPFRSESESNDYPFAGIKLDLNKFNYHLSGDKY